MKIKTVAVLGAGAVGSYVIWGLSRRKDIRLGVLAEGKRAEKLKKGCTINDEVYHPEVWTPQEAKGVDLLIVSLKYGALPGAMDSIRQVTGENTTVMSLMNGVDSEKLISDEIGASHVIYSVIKVASHKEENGYCFNPETTIGIIFGEPCAPYVSERVQAIEALFADTGLHYRSTEYIREEIWSKFRLNVCNNLPQAILGAGVGCYQDSVHMKAISDGLRRELEAIASAKGIDISKAVASSGHGSAVPPSARYSTLQRARCEAALKLVKPSDSVQETRTRLALMLFGLPIPQTQYGITDSENGYTYTVDMAYPQYKVAIEYDGDHHRRFRKQYVRDQQKRRRLRQLGWTVIEVFADDLWNTAKQRAFAQEVATAMQIPLPGRPQPSCRVLIDGSLTINARKGEYRRRKQAKHNKASQH